MKIETKILRDYINKVSLSGTIATLNLNFTDEGVTTRIKNITGIALTEGMLKKEAFEVYEPIGEIYIKESKMLINSLKTFNDVVTLEVCNDGVILKISDDKREVNNMLAEKSICDNILEKIPDVETTVKVTVDTSVLKRTVADIDLLKVSDIKFVKEGKMMYVQVGKKNEYDYIKNSIECDVEGDVTVGIGASFADVVSSLGEAVTMYLGTDLPITFLEITEFIVVRSMIAPFVEIK